MKRISIGLRAPLGFNTVRSLTVIDFSRKTARISSGLVKSTRTLFSRGFHDVRGNEFRDCAREARAAVMRLDNFD